MTTITEEMIQQAMIYGISEKDAKRGYFISINAFGNGATHIERIDVMDVFASDWEAAVHAEKDGIRIIRDIQLPAEHNAPYIDTPMNRLLLKPLEIKAKRELAAHKERLIWAHYAALFIHDISCYMEIHLSEDGYDYTLYNQSFTEIKCGQLRTPKLLIYEAISALLSDISAQNSELTFLEHNEFIKKIAQAG